MPECGFYHGCRCDDPDCVYQPAQHPDAPAPTLSEEGGERLEERLRDEGRAMQAVGDPDGFGLTCLEAADALQAAREEIRRLRWWIEAVVAAAESEPQSRLAATVIEGGRKALASPAPDTEAQPRPSTSEQGEP